MTRAAPFLALLLTICACAVALGSDTPVAALFFSALLAGLCCALCLFHRGPVGALALGALVGAAGLFGLGVVRNWTGSGAGEYAALAAALGVFAAAQIAGRDAKTLETLWSATLAAGALLAALAFLDFVTSPASMAGFDRPYHRDRLSAPFLSANTAATFYGVFAVLSLGELIRAIRRFDGARRGRFEALLKSAALPAATLLLTLTCVFLTASRAGATLLAASMLLLVFWEVFRGVAGGKAMSLKNAGIALGATALCAIIFAVSGEVYAERFVETFEREDARAIIFPAYIEAVRLAPLAGHGLGGFVFINALIADAQNARSIMHQGAAHNVALQWLLQGGVIGLGFVLAISAGWLSLMRKGLARRSRQTGYVRAAAVAAVFTCAHGMVDYALEIPGFLFLFAWICGLGAGAASGGSRILKPGGGRAVSRAMNLSACAILFLTAALSMTAFLDRASARAIEAMEDGPFMAQFSDQASLGGSAVRLEAIGDRAIQGDDPALAARAYDLAARGEPRDGVLSAKFAYARYLENGFLAPDAAAALARSYLQMPYGSREFALWRLAFMEQIWDSLPPLLQESAVREARTYNQRNLIERGAAMAASQTVSPSR